MGFRFASCIAAAAMALVIAALASAPAFAAADNDACDNLPPGYTIEQRLRGCTSVIAREPGNPVVWLNRGLAHVAQKQYDRAITDFAEAIRLKPDFVEAFFSRGVALRLKGEPERAIADYNEALRLRPDYVIAWFNRGNAYQDLGQYDRAIQDYNQALKLKPDFADAFFGRATSHLGSRRHDQAIADYDRAISLKPGFARAYGNRGYAFLKKGRSADVERAIADSEKALALDPSLAYVRTNLDEARKVRLALLAQTGVAGTGARIALIIANSIYLNAPPLPNSRNDAEDVAAELTKLGYRIFGYPRTDFTRNDMIAEIEAFKKASAGAEAAIVWYSGHGQQMREEGSDLALDWVIPVDAKISRRADVAGSALRLDSLKIAVLSARQLRMVVIDACRNSTFYSDVRATRGMGRNSVTPGILLIQSTQPGNVAQDGDGRNSPFVQAFLETLRSKPKLDIRQLFSGVAGRTVQLTRGDQKPESVDGLGTSETITLAP
jgi:tetratricopeptide (TPR) repeat protein